MLRQARRERRKPLTIIALADEVLQLATLVVRAIEYVDRIDFAHNRQEFSIVLRYVV